MAPTFRQSTQCLLAKIHLAPEIDPEGKKVMGGESTNMQSLPNWRKLYRAKVTHFLKGDQEFRPTSFRVIR